MVKFPLASDRVLAAKRGGGLDRGDLGLREQPARESLTTPLRPLRSTWAEQRLAARQMETRSSAERLKGRIADDRIFMNRISLADEFEGQMNEMKRLTLMRFMRE